MPALANVITALDMTAYGYPAVSAGVLARASTRARGFTEQQITAGTSTVTLTGRGPWLLPQRPVTEVTSVIDDNGVAINHKLTNNWLYVPDPDPSPDVVVLHPHIHLPLVVTFEHGYATVPDTVVEAVCAIAARIGGIPAAVSSGARTEQAGAESVTWGVEAFLSSSGLTAAEEKSLRRLFPKRPRSFRQSPT